MKFAVLLLVMLASMRAPCMSVSDDIDVVVSNGAAHLVFAHDTEDGLDLKPFSGSAAIAHAKILFRKTQGDLTYLVIQIDGPTMLNGGSHYCGAGSEENLVWIKLLSQQVVDLRTVLYDSCAIRISEDSRHATDDKLEIHCSFEDKNLVLRYDNEAPERGLAVSVKSQQQEQH